MKQLSSLVITVLFICVSFTVIGCDKKQKAEEKQVATKKTEELEKALQIDENSGNILYTYYDESEKYITVDKSEDVPDPYRNDVIVINTNLSPEQRQSANKVVVADLNNKQEGYFTIRIEDRATFEKMLQMKRKWKISKPTGMEAIEPSKIIDPNAPPLQATDKIFLYSTSWCSYCRKVRQFFEANKIPFIEKDIEKDPKAGQELQLKCAYGQTKCSGVPVVDWQGVIISGYSEKAYRDMLNRMNKRNKKSPKSKP